MLRLGPSAQAMFRGDELVVEGPRSSVVARRLLDAGMANPRPRGTSCRTQDVTIVVPVRNRAEMLQRLLQSLAGGPRVVVVDDGSDNGPEIEAIASEHGASYLHHPVSRGPGAARNTGVGSIETPLVAFVDSDCVVEPCWLEPLLAHFDDPAVALVAPRVVALRYPATRHDWLTAYEKARSSLDLGPDEGLVAPKGMLSWVPTAAVVVRCSALGDGFAEELRVGEDVDLVWRLQKAGWRIRYDPTSHVLHDHRTRCRTWALRKARYGSSAAVLAQRHGRQVAPVVLAPWAAASWLLLLSQRRRASAGAALIAVGASFVLAHRLPPFPARGRAAAALAGRGFSSSGLQVASALVRAWWPLAALSCLVSRRARRAVLVAGLVDGLVDWARHRPPLDPLSYMIIRRADDIAYGAGLWKGALENRSLQALLPDVSFRPHAGSRR